MKLFKEIYRKDGINLAGKFILRQAVRAIIRDERKLLMIYSPINGDYKFPGGGVDHGEDHETALLREIAEECGACTARVGAAFGRVNEYDIPVEPDFDVFKMTSFYYFCTLESELCEQRLEDYEADLKFQPVWVEIDEAIRNNREVLKTPERAPFWARRELFMLETLREKVEWEDFIPDADEEGWRAQVQPNDGPWPGWVPVGAGRLALDHRPNRKRFGELRETGCSVVVTLLAEREGARDIGQRVTNAGMEWIWLPLENGNLPQGAAHERLAVALPDLSARLDAGQSLFIHCSAGIHRTGTVAYGLLRWRGMNDVEAMTVIAQARMVTAEGMGQKRKRWGMLVSSQKESAGEQPAVLNGEVGEP